MKQRDEVRAVTNDEAKGTVEEKLRKQQLHQADKSIGNDGILPGDG